MAPFDDESTDEAQASDDEEPGGAQIEPKGFS